MRLIVTEDVKIMLNGQQYLLEAGDEITVKHDGEFTYELYNVPDYLQNLEGAEYNEEGDLIVNYDFYGEDIENIWSGSVDVDSLIKPADWKHIRNQLLDHAVKEIKSNADHYRFSIDDVVIF